MNFNGKQRRNQATTVNIFDQQELVAKAEAIRCSLKASTWHGLGNIRTPIEYDSFWEVSNDLFSCIYN